MRRRLAVALTITAFVLAFGWNVVPDDITYQGPTITCWPASVDRSSDPADVSGRVLACRPTAAERETQALAGLAIGLSVIWGTYTITRRRRGVVQRSH